MPESIRKQRLILESPIPFVIRTAPVRTCNQPNASPSILIVALMVLASPAHAQRWDDTAVLIHNSKFEDVFRQEEYSATVVTLQHASGWDYGSNFFYIDHITTDTDQSFYGEWYPFFSGKQIAGWEFGGAIADIDVTHLVKSEVPAFQNHCSGITLRSDILY